MLSVRACGRVLFAASLLSIAGCRTPFPFANDPYAYGAFNVGPSPSIVSDQGDIDYITTRINATRFAASVDPSAYSQGSRNEFLTLKMYLVDKAYFEYERQLYNEDVGLNSLGAIGALGSNIVATAIPVGQATKALTAVAAGLTGATSLYDQKVLLTQTIQALQIQMRTNRDKQASTIFAKMACSADIYTLGMAMSDVEVYARSGTIEAALQGLNKTVADARDSAKEKKDTASSGAGNAAKVDELVKQLKAALSEPQKCPLREEARLRSPAKARLLRRG